LLFLKTNDKPYFEGVGYLLQRIQGDPATASFDPQDCRMACVGSLGDLALREPKLQSASSQHLPDLMDHKWSTHFLGRFWAV
jgi:hypothetical protein